ncbi:winged helix-turn-helix domain-containing protein [Pseudoalteromonas sp. S16_S37]|uniref:winged helix-turn-helix domain-containing protein n=1 Tax=Pseudoalteromonas sp. S16_S37 TaxID=2720228 RepID=UPI00168146A8|nr:winged helix-turn-helix domain-containing protein [Pseudoalteromonas sp. S16_S37]MBD1584121.1 hypothetical protein [Pseudoalteromonas sp. S16_S37]
MVVTFDGFHLNIKSGVLTHKGKEIALKPKQRALLLFFLNNPAVVLSKEQILDHVWQGRVVSEQVVFQTISQLRAIVGERAIQTYARQGYKWTYPIIDSKEQEQISVGRSKKSHTYTYFIIAILLVATMMTSYHIFTTPTGKQAKIFYLPQEHSKKIIEDSSDEAFTLRSLKVNTRYQLDVLNMPALTFKELQLDKSSWLIGTRIYPVPEGAYLEFKLQSEQAQWHDYVFATKQADITTALHQRLAELARLGLFTTVTSRKVWVSKLEQQTQYNKANVLFFLAKYYRGLGHLDVALAYLDSISKQPLDVLTMPLHIEAALLRASIYKHNGQFTLAKTTLTQAEQSLGEKIWPLQFELIKKQAFLAYAMRNPEQVKQQLERGAKLAQHNIDAISRFQLHILDSILSAKLGLNERKYIQLNEAQQVVMDENLHPANLAFVYFHYALFAEEQDISIKYFAKILTLPRSQTNFWVIDDAFERLFELYVQHKNFAKAGALLTQNINLAVNKNLLHAKLLLAQQQIPQAIALLEEAYQRSQKAFDKNASIAAARALYLYLDEQSNKRQIYYDFLQRNGEQTWLESKNSKQG